MTLRPSRGASLGFDRLRHLQPCETRGFRFLGDWRQREESGFERESAGPSSGSRQRRHTRTEEGAVLAVQIQTSVPRFDYTFAVPGAFAQYDVTVSPVSCDFFAGEYLDAHRLIFETPVGSS